MKRTFLVLGWATVLMGIIHILLVFPINEFRLGHMWFIGTGIAIVFAGFINLIAHASQQSKMSFILVLLSNVIMCFLFIMATIVLREPQVYIGIVLFGVLGVLTVLNKRSKPSP